MSEKELIKKRGSYKGQLTQFVNFISNFNKSPARADINELKSRINKLATLFNNFDETQIQLEVLAENQSAQLLERAEFESTYHKAHARSLEIITAFNEPANEEPTSISSRGKYKAFKLPTIPLPKFDGAYENWLSFHDTFKSMVISNEDLDDITKFHYLKSSLGGSALECISSIEVSEINYPKAWKLLCERFDNKRLLTQNHLTALLGIDMGNKECSASIKRIIDQINKNLRSLESLGEPTKHWDTLLIHIISRKLDGKTFREWEENKNRLDKNTSITLEMFITFLRSRADFLESLELSRFTPTPVKTVANPNKLKTMVSIDNSSQESAQKCCPKCSNNHALSSCPDFLKLTNEQRLSLLPNLKVCYNCLQKGHYANRCKKAGCKMCHRKHNLLIHVANYQSTSAGNNNSLQPATMSNQVQQQPPPPPAGEATSDISLSARITTSPIQTQQVLLSTALIKVYDIHNNVHIARAVLDSGSTSCLVTEKLHHKLNLPYYNINRCILGINNSNSLINKMCKIHLKSLDDQYFSNITCFVLPIITDKVPCQQVDISSFNLPSNIVLADPNFHTPSDVDIIIGADIFWDLLGSQRIRLGDGKPILTESRLGWLISGSVNYPFTGMPPQSLMCNFVSAGTTGATELLNEEIQTQLTQFWKLEEVSSKSSYYSQEEQACEDHFKQHTTRLRNGRFCVRIPLKRDYNLLGDSLSRAKHCLIALERRLSKQPLLKQMYINFMSEYETLGHMTEVSFNKYNKVSYFIPHHGILRESSTTTKLRAVFNASSATSSGLSLNNLQMVGPTIQDDLVSILIRFRQHKIVISADIEKMYRQISVHPQDRHLQQIVWRSDSTKDIKPYELTTISYGLASSPFLAVRCLHQLGLECENKLIADVITKDFFVDDLLSGSCSIEGARYIQQEVTSILASACLPLRKWKSNEPQLLTSSSIAKPIDLNIGLLNASKTLGVNWLIDTDELSFAIDVKVTTSYTKRSVLSIISQVFDPLGLLGPCVVPMKCMLQKLWLHKLSWDEPLPSDLNNQWLELIKALPALNSARVPRAAVFVPNQYIDIHIFSDASQDAYGACLYVCSNINESEICVRLMLSKSRVAPLKPLTIPRLELCAALTGAKLYEKFISSLRVTAMTQVRRTIFWTDSSIVLGWLKMLPIKLQTFVKSRVSDILEITGSCQWRYVPTDKNPADLISRGLNPNLIINNNLWWSGPDFLCMPESSWPNRFCNTENLPEIKLEKVFHVMDQNELLTIIKFDRFSSYSRLVRTTAYILRFITNIKSKIRTTGPLQVHELKNSLNLLIKLSQIESFPEYTLIIKKKNIPKNSSLLKFNIFIDDFQLLRISGRLQNSELSYERKNPILLQSTHRFTNLLFEHEHKRLMHAGPQLLLSTIKETYWPIGGRNLAKFCFRNCLRCRRMRGKINAPLMGNLPRDRLTPGFPFETVGTDYAGPILSISRQGRGSKTVKVYIVIFVCFTTKAVHIELVGDLTSNNFLCALNRFISRRGKPNKIYSDNGTAFVGASNDLARFLKDNNSHLSESAAGDGIEFKFSPAYAPHFGGLWEAGVKSIKFHLYRVLGNCRLTYEELSTVLVQIEGILNSRPLTPLSNDPEDLLPLTPSHFLIGRPITSPPMSNDVDYSKEKLPRFHRLEQLRRCFWLRWNKEYISQLQERVKWHNKVDVLKLNSLVLLKEENLPPLKWRLGRIVALYPGADNVSRVADVRTAKGVVRRAFSKICTLLEDG